MPLASSRTKCLSHGTVRDRSRSRQSKKGKKEGEGKKRENGRMPSYELLYPGHTDTHVSANSGIPVVYLLNAAALSANTYHSALFLSIL